MGCGQGAIEVFVALGGFVQAALRALFRGAAEPFFFKFFIAFGVLFGQRLELRALQAERHAGQRRQGALHGALVGGAVASNSVQAMAGVRSRVAMACQCFRRSV